MAESKKYTYDFSNKDDMLKKIIGYAESPDDDVVRFKEIIRNSFLHCPELLYSLHEKDLVCELFDDDGNLNVDENGEPTGEWDRYLGENANIRPYLFVPETQTEVRHYICYQVSFDEMPRYNSIEKYGLVTFTIFVNGKDSIDESTGIPRHDLISSIIREKINWSNLFGTQCSIVSNKESTTDNNFIVRTLVFQITNLNGILKTLNGNTKVVNNTVRR